MHLSLLFLDWRITHLFPPTFSIWWQFLLGVVFCSSFKAVPWVIYPRLKNNIPKQVFLTWTDCSCRIGSLVQAIQSSNWLKYNVFGKPKGETEPDHCFLVLEMLGLGLNQIVSIILIESVYQSVLIIFVLKRSELSLRPTNLKISASIFLHLACKVVKYITYLKEVWNSECTFTLP